MQPFWRYMCILTAADEKDTIVNISYIFYYIIYQVQNALVLFILLSNQCIVVQAESEKSKTTKDSDCWSVFRTRQINPIICRYASKPNLYTSLS